MLILAVAKVAAGKATFQNHLRLQNGTVEVIDNATQK